MSEADPAPPVPLPAPKPALTSRSTTAAAAVPADRPPLAAAKPTAFAAAVAHAAESVASPQPRALAGDGADVRIPPPLVVKKPTPSLSASDEPSGAERPLARRKLSDPTSMGVKRGATNPAFEATLSQLLQQRPPSAAAAAAPSEEPSEDVSAPAADEFFGKVFGRLRNRTLPSRVGRELSIASTSSSSSCGSTESAEDTVAQPEGRNSPTESSANRARSVSFKFTRKNKPSVLDGGLFASANSKREKRDSDSGARIIRVTGVAGSGEGAASAPPSADVESPAKWYEVSGKPIDLGALSAAEIKRQETIHEMIATEESYINDLKLVISVFMQGIEERQLLSAKDMNTLFSNIKTLVVVNSALLEKFKARQAEGLVERVGDIFGELSSYFKLYTLYCANQADAMGFLSKQKDNADLQDFLRQCMARKECRRLQLSSFLLLPVQRLCKYPLFLRQIVKYTPDGHPDRAAVTAAADAVDRVVETVNESRRTLENQQKVLAIQGAVEFPDSGFKLLEPTRHFVLEGPLFRVKGQGKTVRAYYGFLFNDLFVWARRKVTNRARFQARFVFWLPQCIVHDVADAHAPSGKFAFDIVCAGQGTFRAAVADAAAKRAWLAPLQGLTRIYLEEQRERDGREPTADDADEGGADAEDASDEAEAAVVMRGPMSGLRAVSMFTANAIVARGARMSWRADSDDDDSDEEGAAAPAAADEEPVTDAVVSNAAVTVAAAQWSLDDSLVPPSPSTSKLVMSTATASSRLRARHVRASAAEMAARMSDAEDSPTNEAVALPQQPSPAEHAAEEQPVNKPARPPVPAKSAVVLAAAQTLTPTAVEPARPPPPVVAPKPAVKPPVPNDVATMPPLTLPAKPPGLVPAKANMPDAAPIAIDADAKVPAASNESKVPVFSAQRPAVAPRPTVAPKPPPAT